MTETEKIAERVCAKYGIGEPEKREAAQTESYHFLCCDDGDSLGWLWTIVFGFAFGIIVAALAFIAFIVVVIYVFSLVPRVIVELLGGK